MAMKNAKVWAVALAAVIVGGGVAAYIFAYEGNVAVYVKDAVGVWDHVYVTFSAVDIHESGKSDATWSQVFSGKATVDLAVLTNLSRLLGSVRLAPGHYEQIRITVSNVTGVTAGATVTITVVNGTLKIVQQFDVSSARTTAITLDVDLGRSIHGNVTGWTFTPVIGATVS
jgi:hypothetical protein